MLRLMRFISMVGIVTALMVFFLIAARAGTEIPIDSIDISIDRIYNSQTIDVDKDPGRKYTCMHAAMANALTFSIGETQEFAVDLYRELINRIGDKPQNAKDVWDNLLGDVYKNSFLYYYNFDSYTGADKSRFAARIAGAIAEGWIVILSLDNPDRDYGHAVTVYGVLISEDKTYLIYCDNEDGSYKKHIGLTTIKDGKTYLDYWSGVSFALDSYAKIRVTEEVIERGVRQ